MQAQEQNEKKVRSLADLAEKQGAVPVTAMEAALRDFCEDYGPALAMKVKSNIDLVWEMYDILLSRLVHQPPVYADALLAAKLTLINIATGRRR